MTRAEVKALSVRAMALAGCLAVLATIGFAAGATPSAAQAAGCSAAQLANREPPIIYRPSWLGRSDKVPLVIALHGSGGNPQSMEGLTHFKEVASEHGFVVAFLASCEPSDPWSPPEDLTYISSMIDSVTASQNIDPARVYVTGFSAGGYETWRAGCQISGKIAAIAIVSDAMSAKTIRACSLSRPISQLLMAGTANGYIYAGIPGRLPSALQTTAWWRSVDGCAPSSVTVVPASTVTAQTWTSCRDGTAVALYEIQGAQHVWPPYGTGAPTNYSASEAVFAFLSAHRAAPLTLPAGDANLVSAVARRNGRGRGITVTFQVTEPVKISQLSKLGRARLLPATSRPVAGLAVPGGASRIQVTLSVPSNATGRHYTFVLVAQDPYGRRHSFTRTVRLPR